MRTLDARAWQAHFTELRTPVLSAFPRLHRQDVEATGDDFDALVHLIQRHSGLSTGEVHDRLRRIEVSEVDGGLEVETGGGDGAGSGATIDQLRIEFGFEEQERPKILDLLRKLDRQLKRFPADAVDMELQVKDRDTTAQKLTIEVRLPGLPRIVATSNESSMRDALMDVRNDILRQIKEQQDRRLG